MCKYSIVIPVHNEQDSLTTLHEEIQRAMRSVSAEYEEIFVNDGSTDRTLEILKRFEKENPQRTRIIHSQQRRGQTDALRKGLEAVQGNVAITIDADLQNDPSDIPRLIDALNEDGYAVICGWRKARQDRPFKAFLSKLGNILQRSFTGLNIHDVSCTMRAYKKECLEKIPLRWEGQHRFIPVSLALQGYKVGEVIAHHRQRRFGKTKYSHKRIFQVIVGFFKVLKQRGR